MSPVLPADPPAGLRFIFFKSVKSAIVCASAFQLPKCYYCFILSHYVCPSGFMLAKKKKKFFAIVLVGLRLERELMCMFSPLSLPLSLLCSFYNVILKIVVISYTPFTEESHLK